jgi:hypothetical protein
MKHEVLLSAEQKLAEDQIRRGVSLRIKLQYVSEYSWGYALGEKPVVQYTPTLSGRALIIELLDPNPEYEQCGEHIQTLWVVDLRKPLDLIEEIEAIADHLIDHQIRRKNRLIAISRRANVHRIKLNHPNRSVVGN